MCTGGQVREKVRRQDEQIRLLTVYREVWMRELKNDAPVSAYVTEWR